MKDHTNDTQRHVLCSWSRCTTKPIEKANLALHERAVTKYQTAWFRVTPHTILLFSKATAESRPIQVILCIWFFTSQNLYSTLALHYCYIIYKPCHQFLKKHICVDDQLSNNLNIYLIPRAILIAFFY